MFHVKHSLRRLLILALVVLVSGCVATEVNPVSGNKRAVGYTWEQELELGKQADQQTIAQYGLYDNQELANYVTRIGEEVLAESDLRKPGLDPKFRIPFTFRVLDSPVVNAFALPGGYVYVTRGLMAHLENEAQLAMVLGHEIGHVAARHASQRAATQQLTQLGLLGGAIAGQVFLGGDAAENILGLGGQAAQLLFLSYSRDNERESDRLGVEYAAKAGYAAGEGAAFFESLKRISAQQGGSIPSWQSTHPDPGEREVTIQRLAADWAERPGITMTEVDAETYLRQIDGVVLGENPRQGLVRNNTFYHPDLKFRFPVPGSWQVSNQPRQVVMAEPNGQAFMVLSLAQEASAEAAASAFAGQQGLTNVERSAARPSGLPAQVVSASAQLEGGQNVRLLNYFIDYDGNVYSILGLTTIEGYPTHRGTFLNTMDGFAPLNDPAILNIQPTRINVTPAGRTAAFQVFVPAQLPEGINAEDLAIINQVQLGDLIQQGALLKLPAN